MTRICDLFQGWHVQLEQRSSGFRVTLIDDSSRIRLQQSFKDPDTAIAQAGQWFTLITSLGELQVENVDKAQSTLSSLLNRMGTHHLPPRDLYDVDEVPRPYDLGEWFKQQWRDE